jgi:hypothetical protein
MACCGKKRAQFLSSLPMGLAARRQQPPPPPPARLAAPVVFEYRGPIGMTALGTVTRRLYRFDRPGARVEVDARDAPAVGSVPNLRRLP